MRKLSACVLVLAVFAAGCAAYDSEAFLSCRSDLECNAGQVCFPEGCGDPGKNIVVEVVPNPKGGLFAQDFRVEDLRSEQNIELFDPASLRGQVLREAEGATSAPYSASITLRATGESLLIPGVVRRHEATLTPLDGGYTLPMGAGRYNVTLLAADGELPPFISQRDVPPGQDVTLDFLLPASTSLTRLSGKVVHQGEQPVDADLEVQAFSMSMSPLSQRVLVRRGTSDFSLTLPPSAAWESAVLLQVSPTSAEFPVPRKVFSVSPSAVLEPLELGDYGMPVQVRGVVKSRDGQPLAQATVYLQGLVGGGGHYRSQKTLTDETGAFTLYTLPSHPEQPMTLYVIPPPGASAGLTLSTVNVPRTGVTVADVVCGERTKVQGTLLMPEGSKEAAGVRVVAEPLEELPGWPRPAASVEAVQPTDNAGRFEIALDPGQYRLDFLPSEGLPRVSRIVTVKPSEVAVELSSFTLSKGRRITGQVSFSGAKLMQSAAPYASVRFFRVVNVEGKPSALLLAQTLTDQNGAYTTTLPTR